MKPTALRWVAMLVAAVAVADPGITSRRPARPLVSVLPTDGAGREEVGSVERALSGRFDVVRAPLSGAAATVLVGSSLPDEATAWSGSVFAVRPSRLRVRVEAMAVPARASVGSKVPVRATLAVAGASARRLEVELLSEGVVADHRAIEIASAQVQASVAMSIPAVREGALPVRLRAWIAGSDEVAEATDVLDVTGEQARVLFYDPRPSWLSTFVRRSVERDARVEVAYRQVTSRGVASTLGAPPQSLADPLALASWGAIVVGSPEHLSVDEVRGLEAYLRRRGGRAVLLMDRAPTGAVGRLTGVAWRVRRSVAAREWRADSLVLRGREAAVPSSPAIGWRPLAVAPGSDSAPDAAVWSLAVGAGRLAVNGALDSWHFRDPADSDFDRFWAGTVHEMAMETPPLVDLSVSRRSLRPGESANISITLTEEALRGSTEPAGGGVTTWLISERDTQVVRVWPESRRGRFTGALVAPLRLGTYRLQAGWDVSQSSVSLEVDSAATGPTPGDSSLIASFVSSRGGRIVSSGETRSLADEMAAAFGVEARVETWHPMRSPWWIIPFVLLLGSEWWWRRRRGLP